MSDSSNTPPSEETSEVTPSPKERTENLTIKWIEVISKAIIAGVGVVIAWFGSQYQQSSMNTQLLLQQERGDIEIRAQMFGKITEHLMKGDTSDNGSKSDVSPIDQSLLTQMLALNFHELIELKPLMLSLDRKLAAGPQQEEPTFYTSPTNENEYSIARKELRSVARRIRDRQLSTLFRTNPSPSDSKYRDSRIVYFTAYKNKYIGNDSCGTTSNVASKTRSNICFNSPIYIDDFYEGKKVQITVNKADWLNKTFKLSFESNMPPPVIRIPKNDPSHNLHPPLNYSEFISYNQQFKFEDMIFNDPILITLSKLGPINIEKLWRYPTPLKISKNNPDTISIGERLQRKLDNNSCRTISSQTERVSKTPGLNTFNVTEFDFPLTDNTLKSDNRRYAIFIDKICEPKGHSKDSGSVRLGLLFFPKDFYPSRERPSTYSHLKKLAHFND